jgi:glycosyltransferase involved in cell wall biosynthesis
MEKDEGSGLKIDHSKICFLSNFPPRECGIATFTQDLSSALDKRFNPRLKSRVIALNEEAGFYNYGDRVVMQINKDDIEDFIEKAKKINQSDKIKLVCIQHEFGLFGGRYGEFLVPFLETIEKPVIVTFHSILPNPNRLRRKVVRFICEKSAAIVVMAHKAIEVLRDHYGVDEKKIYVIRHGVPNVAFSPPSLFKKKLKLEGKITLSSFGLLSKGKGIERVIRALPELVKKYPNILYLVIGETHPKVREKEGEKYRNKLIKEVERLGLKDNVKFYNKYLTLREIISYLLASDIYICSNLEREQIVSGTLSYALGCGKAIISSPTFYAEEVLANGRGLIVDFNDKNNVVRAIDKILSDEEFRRGLEREAYSFSRSMIWANVATRYLSLFNRIVRLREETIKKYPTIKLTHLKNLTDNFGCIQFAKLSLPDKDSGYTVDDNSRALIAAILHNSLFDSQVSKNLIETYLNFLEYAQDNSGWFNNVIREEGKIIEDNSEDAFGRCIWSLGFTIAKSNDDKFVEKAKKIFDKSYKLIDKIGSPRAKAFSILGLYYYYKKYENEEIIENIKKLADSLVALYKEHSSNGWEWFEDILAYSNSKLPESLFFAYELTADKEYLEIAKKTLDFLSGVVFVKDKLCPIGHNGWYNKNGERAFFDQQPVDASSMVQTFLHAYSVTKNREYYDKAVLAFNWFLGNNYLNQMIYDESTGGCYDGLSEASVNLNQGAESTISYLLARLFLEEVNRR